MTSGYRVFGRRNKTKKKKEKKKNTIPSWGLKNTESRAPIETKFPTLIFLMRDDVFVFPLINEHHKDGRLVINPERCHILPL